MWIAEHCYQCLVLLSGFRFFRKLNMNIVYLKLLIVLSFGKQPSMFVLSTYCTPRFSYSSHMKTKYTDLHIPLSCGRDLCHNVCLI